MVFRVFVVKYKCVEDVKQKDNKNYIDFHMENTKYDNNYSILRECVQ